MRWTLWIFLGVLGMVILVVTIGWLLPKDHVATRVARYHQPPEALWSAITDVDAMPSWREGLKSVKKLPDRNGLPVHVEVTGAGDIPLETIEMTRPRKLVARIAGAKLPFGGAWTFEITPVADGAMLRITENGYVTNPVFRFMSRFVLGYAGEIEKYLQSLARKFGERAHIEG